MGDLLYGLLSLLIIIVGIAVMVGFPFRPMLKAVGKWGVILLAIVVIAPMLPSILNHLQNNPPQSLQEAGIWLALSFVLLLLLVRIIFGSGSASRLVQHLIAAGVYDVLKGLAKALFYGYRWSFGALVRLFK